MSCLLRSLSSDVWSSHGNARALTSYRLVTRCLNILRLRSLILRQAKPTSVPWYKKFNWYSFALYRYKV